MEPRLVFVAVRPLHVVFQEDIDEARGPRTIAPLLVERPVSKWIKTADLAKLEHAVYQGKASYLRGRTAWNEDIRNFLITAPNVAASIESFHSAASAGDEASVERLLASDRRLISSRDQVGRTALHKASKQGALGVVRSLLNGDLTAAENLARATDKEGRSVLHYAARAADAEARSQITELLQKAGADPKEEDKLGHKPEFYVDNEFPPRRKGNKVEKADSDRNEENEGAKEEVQNNLEGDKKLKDKKKKKSSKFSAEAAKAVEEADFGKLVELVLDGHGSELRGKATENEEVQEFLDNVPAFQEKIILINSAVESGSLHDLQTHLDRKKFALARDPGTGINFLQKAIVLGHSDIVRYLATNFPKTMTLTDFRGRTALHFAALTTDETGQHFFNLLATAGADQKATDSKGNTPEHLLTKASSSPAASGDYAKDLLEAANSSTFQSPKTAKAKTEFKAQVNKIRLFTATCKALGKA